MKKSYYIGIDPGINVGMAEWSANDKSLKFVASYQLWEVFRILDSYTELFKEQVTIRIENPNTWIGFRNISADAGRLQGAGAVKQTYKHLIEYFEANGFEYQPVKLQGTMKKISSEKFKSLTGWTGRTNEHGRDAAMMVWKMG